MEKNRIFQEDCLITMNNMPPNFVDLVITSPPYNFSKKRKGGPSDTGKYDQYKDNMNEDEKEGLALLREIAHNTKMATNFIAKMNETLEKMEKEVSKL